MTPQRQAYFDKCSKRERVIRDNIDYLEHNLKIFKEVKQANDGGENWVQNRIRNIKISLSAYRHELARLKGMDRVVRAKEFQEVGSQGLSRCSKCGEDLSINERFCSACGRKILWEKVK